MKEGIHPDYKESVITCACGNVVHTRSVKPEIKIEICNKCHPYFTGKQRILDSTGMVERFNRRYGKKSVSK
ncbi:MAG: 50S ribosomal protein L31 [Candidatus Omnitrophica bacterium]|jgi:large subunit ribosomal protein L31|nr:50S ribosomal protein L31 [Candidatus Omnitrophota bacterium]